MQRLIINQFSETDCNELTIVDIGCGPGNFLRALKNIPNSVTGVDLSDSALKIASEFAQENKITFNPIKSDIRHLKLEEKFDIVISVNSILPDSREEIIQILRSVRGLLKPNGVFYAILPSFDTTQYLRGLWHNHYNNMFNDQKHADRCLKQLDSYKLVDRENCMYADDGANTQAYHTDSTIIDEFRDAGLVITHGPKKIHYPWELTRKFDYGYFPEESEEIWDWYVVAQKGN